MSSQSYNHHHYSQATTAASPASTTTYHQQHHHTTSSQTDGDWKTSSSWSSSSSSSSSSSWQSPTIIDDNDLTFDGKPLNLLHEENQNRVWGGREVSTISIHFTLDCCLSRINIPLSFFFPPQPGEKKRGGEGGEGCSPNFLNACKTKITIYIVAWFFYFWKWVAREKKHTQIGVADLCAGGENRRVREEEVAWRSENNLLSTSQKQPDIYTHTYTYISVFVSIYIQTRNLPKRGRGLIPFPNATEVWKEWTLIYFKEWVCLSFLFEEKKERRETWMDTYGIYLYVYTHHEPRAVLFTWWESRDGMGRIGALALALASVWNGVLMVL